MSTSKFFQLFLPKSDKFNDLFEQAADNLVKATDVLKEIASIETETDTRNNLVAKVKEHEVIGDYITHTIFEELNKTFITPFDRDDIHNLTSSIDDVVDYINAHARVFYYISRINCRKNLLA
ncbi:MAG: DUF47 family protein [Bacteroidia bacterium]|nr:DUF47 family protein [Bacteroidia bacterium]